jgi:hypothetical protein
LKNGDFSAKIAFLEILPEQNSSETDFKCTREAGVLFFYVTSHDKPNTLRRRGHKALAFEPHSDAQTVCENFR